MATKIPQCKGCGGAGHYSINCLVTAKTVPRAGKHTNKDRAENKKLRESKLNHQGYLICNNCGSWDGSDADHIVKKSVDPSKRYDPENKQILCRRCHTKKDK